ncbi:MAG: GNAT family N-acetyltransferase [Lachnospiraceae bacterium]|nr:GNAT family N-acetyltransferase [Lachnospiraceae bacterium]
MYCFRRIGMDEIDKIKELFTSVFTVEPWNDDWSDQDQLDLYLFDLVGQSNSLTFGLYEENKLIGVSMGHIKHWFSGTEYCIDELCIRKENQGNGLGTLLLSKIEESIRKMGLVHLFLQTEKTVPAYRFYQKNGYTELDEHVSFVKRI